jgi:hypothetical protein
MYLFSLVGFLSISGMLGFSVTASHHGAVLQDITPPVQVTPVAPQTTDLAGIPVTGEPEPVWTEILGFYGLIGLAAMFLTLALLNLANKSTVQHVEHKAPSSDQTHKD